MILLLAGALLLGCSIDSTSPPPELENGGVTITNSDDGSRVSGARAADVAAMFLGKRAGSSTKSFDTRAISTMTTINDQSNNPLIYVINYQGDGFILISATEDYYPVLAYSETGSFVVSGDMPGGLTEWLNTMKYAISTSETMDPEVLAKIHNQWAIYSDRPEISASTTKASDMDAFVARAREIRDGGVYDAIPARDGEQYITPEEYDMILYVAEVNHIPLHLVLFGVREAPDITKVGPLTTTQWSQFSPYNALCPNYNELYPFRYPAGCVAIAMAQIMKYHQHPTGYNWSNMPNTTATTHTQSLIAAVGVATQTVYEQYWATSDILKAKHALTTHYGYNVDYKMHNKGDVEGSINGYRPVFMTGVDSGSEGHAWVCDGVERRVSRYQYFVEFPVGSPGNYVYKTLGSLPSFNTPSYSYFGTSLYFRMNWGWGGDRDGWFFEDAVADGLSINRQNLYISPIK